ncbi:MAG: DUF3971 domain-containing protein [Halioglobus sp.]
MEHSYFNKLSKILWTALVAGVVLLAVYVSLGRFLMSNVGAYQQEILAQLNQRLPFKVEAREVRGEWHAFTPELVMRDLRLTFSMGEEVSVELNEGRLALDTLGTLRARSLRGRRLELQRLSLQGEISDDGRFRITGLGGGSGNFVPWMESFLASIEQVVLVDNTLRVALPGDEHRTFDLDLKLQREGRRRIVSAAMVSTAGTRITAMADGLGNPFDSRTYTGDLYLDVALASLESVRDLLPSPLTDWNIDGALNLEAWIRWQSGEPSLEVRLAAENLEIASPAQEAMMPIDYVSLQASLVDRRNRRTIYVSDFNLRAKGQEISIPRLQFDSWGDSMRLRAAEMDVGPLNALAIQMGLMPQGLRDVFTVLQPAGLFPVLQFHLEDYREPAQGWTLEARFEDFSVQGWKGAPGVNAAQGYVNLQPGSGEVLLDSQLFALDFPTLYEEPLFYDDFYGTIGIDWDAQGLQLSSGQIIASGVEGTAKAIFGLTVPFEKTDVGIEMDLLVGLESSHPIHRTKYIPRTLNKSLVDWLRVSVGEGKVEQGAFLWRGSLLKQASAHRTVQLFFNVADTKLNYHDAWPEVTNLDGVVLIDDTNVSVWANSARLYDTQVDHLSAEAWLADSGQMQLALDGYMRGSAEDGLRVINNSPINSILGEAFTQWEFSGSLETDLQLQMNLNDAGQFPIVEVVTTWRDVDALIRPSELPITALNGVLLYSSRSGLHSRDMRGRLWGEDLDITVEQVTSSASNPTANESATAYDPKTSAVRVRFDTKLDMEDIRNWQDLEQLAFAQGVGTASGSIVVNPGEIPRFTATSNLVGVSLDLPEPYGKSGEQEMPFEFDLPLGGDQILVGFSAPDHELQLMLDITGGVLRGGTLGFGQGDVEVRADTLTLTGYAPLVDEARWSDFFDHYFASNPESPADPNSPVDPNAPSDLQPQFALNIENLRADRLQIWGAEVAEVTLNLRQVGANDDWRVTAENFWFAGELELAKDYSQGDLQLSRLDISGLETLYKTDDGDVAESEPGSEKNSIEGNPEWQSLELPTLSVAVSNLRNGELELGELNFQLRTTDDALVAENIVGNLAGMEILAEDSGLYSWHQDDTGGSSALKVNMQIEDFGDVLSRFNYQRTLESESGDVRLDLNWPGGPQDFGIIKTLGSSYMTAKNGRFLNAPQGASGTLRVVSLLNFAGIVQRLSLTHMFESGIPFDSLRGEAHFHAGKVEIDPIEVKGASSGFRFNGMVELADEGAVSVTGHPELDPDSTKSGEQELERDGGAQVSGELVVALPVANNLPWVAALAAGLPVAAGVFVVSKVFEKQVNRASSGVYTVSGSLDNPDIAFDRIFDNTGGLKTIVDPNAPPQDANSPTVPGE